MTKFILSGLLALAAFAATSETAQAGGPFGCPSCVGLFGKMHQHGPLYNYGPYYGYYPFAPYGPWNSDLTLNNNCGGKCGGGLKINLPHPFAKKSCDKGCDKGCDGCDGWKHYANHTWTNVFHRTHPCHQKSSCSGCTSAAPVPFAPIQPVSAAVPAK